MINRLAIAALGLIGSSAAAQTPATRTIAVTFDDLPYVAVGDADYLSSARRGTAKILSALRANHAPATAFTNEGKLQHAGEVEARTALLRQWVDAGMVLGNHTYSHADFNTRTIAEFEDEIARGDVVTRRLMKARQPYQLYFRHPMTHTGDTPAKKAAVEAFLTARGYKVTPHTIENSDFIFNVGYAHAVQARDTAAIKRLRDAYLDFTIAATEFAERISPQIFAREVAQTLLIHANDINADCLDELLHRLAARGYRFVTLDQAMADPAYQTRDSYVGTFGPTWLFRWMKSKGMSLSFAADPEPPSWVVALSKPR